MQIAGMNLSRLLLSVLLLLSGFAGISYEILYGRMLGNLIGDQFAVSASILITFLLGIGIGSAYAYRLWRYLWLIELTIGLYGAAFTLGHDGLDSLLYLGFFPESLAASIFVCIALLALPSMLIGCSIPLFAGYLSREIDGAVFPGVYAIYNFGAALTALLIEFFVIRWLGIQGAVLGFAAINILIAIGLRFGFAYPAPAHEPDAQRDYAWLPRQEWIALALASIASAAFQLFMLKLAEMFLGPFRESFALVLSIVLLGIAAGSLLTRRMRLSLTHVLVLALTGMVLILAATGFATELYARLYDWAATSYWGVVALKWVFLTFLMGLPALCFGATIPALLTRHGDVSRESGQLLFIASLANAGGFLLMVFVLHRYLDYGLQLLVMSGIVALAILVYHRFRPWALAGVAVGATLVVAAFLYQWNEKLLYLSYTNFQSADALESAKKEIDFPDRYRGYQDVFSINWMDGDPYFFINGYISIPLNNSSEKVVGALSSMYAPRSDDALVLGLGSGATASTVGLAFDHTDVVEINPVVRENLFRMRQWNYDIEQNPNVDIIVDDAIHYSKATEKQYSLILNTVTTPLYFSSSKLYTTDFFHTIHKRMKPDGIYVTWMDYRIGDKGVDIILNSLAHEFRHCAIFYLKSAYFMLVCSDQPIMPSQAAHVAGIKRLRTDLASRYGIVAEWLPYQILNREALTLRGDTDGPLNSNDYPALEFEMARLRNHSIRHFKTRLRDGIDLAAIREASNPASSLFPADLLRHAGRMISDSSLETSLIRAAEASEPELEKKKRAAARYRWQMMATLRGSASDHHFYGHALAREGRDEEAMAEYREALALDPRSNNTHFNMAMYYLRHGNYAEAERHLHREAEIDPSDRDVDYQLARVALHTKHYRQALRHLELARKAGHSDHTVTMMEIDALASLGRCDAARQRFATLLEPESAYLRGRFAMHCGG
jgi:predicted membrane-bound spermidine synthase/tetratricopeptide (TPR) repeat protein